MIGQKDKIIIKYTQAEELDFWRNFANTGLLAYENMAIQKHLSPGSYILDIGCGCGREAYALCKQGFSVAAMDIVPQFVELAINLLKTCEGDFDFLVADVTESIPFKRSFDAAVMFEQIYQHIPQKNLRIEALHKIHASLHDNGILMLSAFNEGDINIHNRWRWLRESRFLLPKMLIARGINLLDVRYSIQNANQLTTTFSLNLTHRLKIIYWLIAYFKYLVVRKHRTRITPEAYKEISRCSPGSKSKDSFGFSVLSLAMIERELQSANFEIVDIFPLLCDQFQFTAVASKGAPLLLIVDQKRIV